MPLKRKHDPGYKLPEVIEPEENCCICIPIPNDFNHKMAFLGQLDELGYWWNWERDELKQGREAAAVWRKIVACVREDMNMNDCGCGDRKITNQRWTSDGRLEISYDNGETWENGDEFDARFNSVVFPGIPGTDGEEKRCQAANSALAVFMEEKSKSSAILGGAGTVGALIASVAAAIAATGVGIVPAAIIALMGGILVAIVQSGQTVFDNSFTSLIWDEFFCSLYCQMEDDGSYTEAGWQGVIADAASLPNYPANAWLSGMVKSAGVVGLTNAARTGYAGSRDCDSCPCDDNWCYYFDFSTGDLDWEVVTAGGYLNGSWPGSPGWTTTDTVNTSTDPDSANRLVYIQQALAGTILTKIEMTYDFTGGFYDTTTLRALIFFVNGVDVRNIQRAAMMNGTSLVETWEGQIGGVNDVFLWIRPSRDISSPYSYSGSAVIRSVRLEGKGDNPFGVDNCP